MTCTFTKYILIILFCFCIIGNYGYAHEPWLLTTYQIQHLNAENIPKIFSELSFHNCSILFAYTLIIFTWIFINIRYPEPTASINVRRQHLAILFLRLGLGSTLILLSLGLLPKAGVLFFKEATILAPEFLLNELSNYLYPTRWIELVTGLALISGVYVRIFSMVVGLLLVFAFTFFGIGVLQYAGFYLGIIFFLVTQGSGKYAICQDNNHKFVSPKIAIFTLQLLKGVNFIYSAITIKLFHPNLDIGILQINDAFTFWIPYDIFTFLMVTTEVTLGILLILGFRLRIVAIILMILFLFLSFDLSENILMHNFIYGILFTFIFLNGVPLIYKKH